MIHYESDRDTNLDTLLDLDGSILDQENGWWIKIEARRVAVSTDVPHGIRYSLTLHEPYGTRVLGYDNAHGVRPAGKFKYAGRVLPFDHKHRHAADVGVPYEFTNVARLLQDFFDDVDRILSELNPP